MDLGIQELFKKHHQIDISELVDYSPYLLRQKESPNQKLTLLFANTLNSASEINKYKIYDETMMRIKYPLIREGELKNAFTAVLYNNTGNVILCSYGIVVLDNNRYIQILEGAMNKEVYNNPGTFIFQPKPKQGLVDMLTLN